MPLERLNLSINTKKKISRKLGLDSVCFFISNLMLLANLFWTLVDVVTFTGPPYLGHVWERGCGCGRVPKKFEIFFFY